MKITEKLIQNPDIGELLNMPTWIHLLKRGIHDLITKHYFFVVTYSL